MGQMARLKTVRPAFATSSVAAAAKAASGYGDGAVRDKVRGLFATLAAVFLALREGFIHPAAHYE